MRLQLLYPGDIGITGSHVQGYRQARRQLHRDIKVGVRVAKQPEHRTPLAADIEQQLIAFAALGDRQLVQRRVIGCACPTGQRKPLAVVPRTCRS